MLWFVKEATSSSHLPNTHKTLKKTGFAAKEVVVRHIEEEVVVVGDVEGVRHYALIVHSLFLVFN